MRNSFSIIIIFIALGLAGIVLLPLLPVKLMPSRELPSLSVDFTMAGHSSRIVEQEVTSRLEGALSRMKGVEKMESRSANGWGYVHISLDRHADIGMARLEASAIVRRLWESFPEGVSYPVVTAAFTRDEAAGPFMTYTVMSSATSVEIEKYVENQVIPVLSDIKGVGSIDIYGVTPIEWRMEYDVDRLAGVGLTLEDIVSAVERHYGTEFLGMGKSEKGYIRLVKKSPGDRRVFDPENIWLTTKNGETVTLSKMVVVKRSEGHPLSYFRINGLNSIYLNISATPDANQLEVGKRVVETMARIGDRAPENMSFLLSNDNTDTIREELDKIYFRTGLTVFILMVFIILVTRNLHYTLLIVISLVVNLAVAVILYKFFGTEIQLYSLAGITISLNLMIDNTIVMCDHYMRNHDRKVFPAILAATLTTVGALLVVFLFNDDVRRNLEDFVVVVVVNLIVSLLVAFFLVPALADCMRCRLAESRVVDAEFSRWRMRWMLRVVGKWLTEVYRRYICFAVRWKWILFLLMAGMIGWSGWLFFDRVREGGYFGRDYGEQMLYVSASLPNGSTLEQMDFLLRGMESFLSGKAGVRRFQTNVYNGRQGMIVIRFTKDVAGTAFPYRLKSEIISNALTLGGGSWSVFGLQDNGFSNDVRESAGNMRIKMYGFNYDELWQYASELRDTLLSRRRIKEVDIRGDFSDWKDEYKEFSLLVDQEALACRGLTIQDFFKALNHVFGRDMDCGYVNSDGYTERIVLSSAQSRVYDMWALMNVPLVIGDKHFKISDFAKFDKVNVPQDIVKENQSYRLCLQYEYIGSYEVGHKTLDHILDGFRKVLPPGYIVEKDDISWGRNKMDYSQYFLLAVIVAVIFFIGAILFNSLLRPLAIIAVIPMSYVGIFLTFWLFKFNFDQGGFASFILLSGITVNAAIYIINEFDRPGTGDGLNDYIKAFKVKLVPVILTVLSTVLGFVPFIVGTSKEGFWFPLAVGTIGGLLFSLIAIVLYLPPLLLRSPRRRLGGKSADDSLAC